MTTRMSTVTHIVAQSLERDLATLSFRLDKGTGFPESFADDDTPQTLGLEPGHLWPSEPDLLTGVPDYDIYVVRA